MKGVSKMYRININITQTVLQVKTTTKISFLTHPMRLELHCYQNQKQLKKKSMDEYFL